jgi:hypothetical protein
MDGQTGRHDEANSRFSQFCESTLTAFKMNAIQNKKLTFTRAVGSRVWELGFEPYPNSVPAVTVVATSAGFCFRPEVGNWEELHISHVTCSMEHSLT